MKTTRDALIQFLNDHMADPSYVGLKPRVDEWSHEELDKAVADIKRVTIKPADPDSLQWPQRLRVYAHDEQTECEEMAAWLKERGIGRKSEAGRLIASLPYEIELIYDVWPNGKVLLLSVDSCAVEKPGGWVDPE